MSPKALWFALLAIVIIASRASAAQTVLPGQIDVSRWPAGVAQQSDLPTTRAYEYEFDAVEIRKLEQWLAWIGIEIPIDISGSLSGWLWAQRSDDGWLNFAGYRVEGLVSCPRLRVEQWEFRGAVLRFGYANDRWFISRLAGTVGAAGSEKNIGQANFAATMPQSAPRLLELSGQVDGVQLQPLLEAFGIDVTIVNKTGRVEVAASVPLDRAEDATAWKGHATVALSEMRSQNFPRSALSAKLEIEDGAWRLADGLATIIEQPIDLTATGQLQGNFPFNASFDGRNLPVAQFFRASKQSQLSARIGGTVDAVGNLRGELVGSEYWFGIESASAALRSDEVQWDGQAIRKLLVEAVLDNRTAGNETLTTEIRSLSVAGGTLDGSVRWTKRSSDVGLVPEAAKIRCAQINLAQLPSSLVPIELAGLANGQIEFSSNLSDNLPKRAWSSDGALTLEGLTIAGAKIGDATTRFSKPIDSQHLQATLSASNQSLNANIDVLTGNAVFARGLVESYIASGKATHFRTRLAGATETTDIPVDLSGNFEVQGSPTNWIAEGKAELTQLVVDLDEQPIELNDLVLNIREDAFRLERFTVRDDRGRIAGSALFRRNTEGEHLLNLRIDGLEIAPYVRQFAPRAMHGLAGQIDLESRLKKSADQSELYRGWFGALRGELDEVEFGNAPVGHIAVNGTLTNEHIEALAKGNVLGGDLKADASLCIAAAPTNIHSNLELAASLTGIRLDRCMALAIGPRLGQEFSGTANLEIKSEPAIADNAIQIRLAVPNFYHCRQQLANDFAAEALLVDERLQVNKLTGGFAEGRIDARGELQLTDGRPTGTLQFAVVRTQLNALAELLFPEQMENFAGLCDYRGRLSIGKQIELSGAAHFTDVSLFQLPIQEIRNELTVGLTTAGELTMVSVRNAQGTVLGGRFDGEASLRGGASYAFQASGKVGHGKLEQLGRGLGFDHIVGSGNFTATARLKSSDITDLAQITGPLQLDFENGDAGAVPILSDIGRLVPVVQMGSTNIKSGTMHGQLGQGQLRINDLVLISDAFWLVADGSASLQTERLDLNAFLQTGSPDDQLLQAGGQKLLAVALPQLALVNEINNLINNRAVYFHVGGSVAHPVIQPQAAQTAAKALLQNVQRRLLVAPSGASVSGSN